MVGRTCGSFATLVLNVLVVGMSFVLRGRKTVCPRKHIGMLRRVACRRARGQECIEGISSTHGRNA